mmetsp:Transcript_4918/g.7429  ORF Transcript_4918/g.7429 Transcript_4918/m.7429 type:complete len:184 (-) Transcript_4918:197-748(-)
MRQCRSILLNASSLIIWLVLVCSVSSTIQVHHTKSKLNQTASFVDKFKTNVRFRSKNEYEKHRKNEIFAKKCVNLEAYKKASKTNTRPDYKLTWLGNMVAGALSRSIAQVTLHPFNVLKTLLQTEGSFKAIFPLTMTDLTRGAGAQFVLSLPMGAINFAVLECTKQSMTKMFPRASNSAEAFF